ncbi:MAG: non-ribosomal peptide synthetase [Anaerolineae bacterium]|nr:MAG: non-ribosomal peptide synthetase [Anaerolineae bacterium]WKZ44875.1 MAG: amino acid adenylation domain-containing protein [Anaerolineales bacterium]
MSGDSNSSISSTPLSKRELLKKLLREKAETNSAPHAYSTTLISQVSQDRVQNLIPRQSREREGFPLSSAQQRLLFLEQFEPNNPIYNISSVLCLHGQLDVDALERSLDAIVQRHESLRTMYTVKNGKGSQSIVAARFSLNHVNLEEEPPSNREAEMLRWANEECTRPIDLAYDLKLRATLIRMTSKEHVIAITLHHISSDGWSVSVFLNELAMQYEAFSTNGHPATISQLPIQYVDYASWHREWLQSDSVEAQVEYWKQQLEDSPPFLSLPTDRPRPALQTFHGAWHQITYSPQLLNSLKALAGREGTTLFMVLLAAFQILLSRYTGQSDVVVGSPIAGRNWQEVKDLIGLFINTMILRTDLSNNPTVREVLQRVRKVVLSAYENQDVPFERLVEELQPVRSLSYPPLFQVMFILQNIPPPDLKLRGLEVSQIMDVSSKTSKYDLTLSMLERPEGLFTLFEYNPDLFEQATINRMAGHLEVLLRGIISDPEQPIGDLPILTEEEQKQILVEWNRTEVAVESLCIHQLFERQAVRVPDATAVRFEAESLTYKEVDERSNQLARHLITLGVQPDTLVGIYMERSADMIVGLLGVLKAGGAYVPLDPAFPSDRLQFMLADSEVSVLLTQQKLANEIVPGKGVTILCVDSDWNLIATQDKEKILPQAHPENLAYVIYTSGSTGKPKGVQIQHHSVVNFLMSMRDKPGLAEHDILLSVTTLSFDIAALEIFLPLTTGAMVELVSRETATDGTKLLAALEKSGATIMQATPVTWRMLIEAGWQGSDDLKILCGGEALAIGLAHQILDHCRELWNMYGPTETTIWSTMRQIQREDREISIGNPIANTQCYILDDRLQPVPVGVIGELYIGGDGLARGYLHRPKLTAEKFLPNPFLRTPSARLYKTGDLVRRATDGLIHFVGRADNQIKIRGFRVELGEIETVLAQHVAIQTAVVVVREDIPDDRRLVAYLISKNPSEQPAISDLRNFLRKTLPEYMVPNAFVFLEEFPLTPNKKVDRKALAALDQTGSELTAQYVAPRGELEERIARIFANVLKLERVGVDDNFFDLGGHSLLATQIMSRVGQVARVDLPLRVLFEFPTVAGLSAQIEALKGQDEFDIPPLKPMTRDGYPRLSFSQERMWFVQQLVPETTAYNITGNVSIKGRLNPQALEQAFNMVIDRHEILRTIFEIVDGEPVQVIKNSSHLSMPVINLETMSDLERTARLDELLASAAKEPFNLAHGPLIRAFLVRLSDGEHILSTAMHHIISDQWSMGVFSREVASIYDSLTNKLPLDLRELPLQYADYSLWQRSWLQGDQLSARLTYWRKQLDGITALDLPTDHPRPAMQTFNGAMERIDLPESLIESVKNLCRKERITPFMFFLAIFKILLIRYSGQNDVAVGTPIANRNWLETENLMGTFVNTVVLRTQLVDNPMFKEFLRSIRELSLDAFGQQDFPFEKLVQELQSERDMSRSPLIQVMFNMLNAPTVTQQPFNDLSMSPIWVDGGTAQFDLTLSVSVDVFPHMLLFYNTDLFKQDTAQRMLGHLRTLMEHALENPNWRILNLPMLTSAEREKQLRSWNDTCLEYSRVTCIHELIEAQVERTPEAIAIVFNSQQMTYRELNERANQLARHLRSLGVSSETPVGISAERSAEMVVGLLAILKAGGTYIPLDPHFPQERIEYMLDTSETHILLTQKGVYTAKDDTQQVICLDSDWGAISRNSSDNLSVKIQFENLAYILFTSGSTGKPKGVQIPHRAVVNFLASMRQIPGMKDSDRLLAVTTLSFDISVLEVFLPLTTGACVVVAPGEEIYDGAALIRRLSNEDITVMQATPATWQMLIEAGWQGDKNLKVLCGGEAMSKDLAEWLTSHVGSVWNMYGPTETTVWSTICAITAETQAITIGRPIANTQIYILDDNLEPTPIGVAGELYIAGDGVARGYLNQPDLTAERFLSDPFSNAPGARMYKTGDQARYLANGQIDFLGRADFQVKIRGFRIELGEIEAVLNSHPNIRQAVVVAREDKPGDKRLAAYLISQTEYRPDVGELRQFIKLKLPEYMIPSSFMFLEEFPMTPNRKVNRKSLPAPVVHQGESKRSLTLPRNEVEKAIADLWTSVLGISDLDIYDNFFDLGGHSLLATRVIARIRDQYQIDLPLRVIFVTPTIAEIAEAVSTILWATQGSLNTPNTISGNQEEIEL